MTIFILILTGVGVGQGPGPDHTFVLPGAVSQAPDWLKGPAPFDVAEFFRAPPPRDNAAPLYLDAFCDFGREILNWHPDPKERDRRRVALEKDLTRIVLVQKSLKDDPGMVVKREIDAAIEPFADGFRNLALAQRREKCVFETGISITALLPHAQAARQVPRVAALRVRRALDDGDFDRAILDVEICLRLARDLEPRGYLIQQLVAIAILRSTATEIIGPILAAPGLKPEHCDRLLEALRRYDERTVDGYVEGIRVEYIMNRVTLHDLIHNQADLAKGYGIGPGESIVKAIAEPMLTSVLASGKSNVPDLENTPRPLPNDADVIVARTSPTELAVQVKKLNAYYAALLDLRNTPYAARLNSAPNPLRLMPGADPLSRVLRGMAPAAGAYMAAIGRAQATMRAFECLIVVRRWELARGGKAADLDSAAREAGLKAVPLDPFDGSPMRLRFAGTLPVVYSVGPDGVDDHGLEDSRSDRQTGDIVLFMPRSP